MLKHLPRALQKYPPKMEGEVQLHIAISKSSVDYLRYIIKFKKDDGTVGVQDTGNALDRAMGIMTEPLTTKLHHSALVLIVAVFPDTLRMWPVVVIY
jgi:hypothetical protein